MNIMMDENVTFKVKHECVLILITLLFEGNEKAQEACLTFCKDPANFDFMIFLEREIKTTFEKVINEVITNTKDHKLKKK